MAFLDYHRTLLFEESLLEEQQQRENMTSFKAYPFPGELVEIPYPMDNQGSPIPPELLVGHSRTTNFTMPYCFHGRTVEIVVREIKSGVKVVTLECGARERGDTRCRFYLNLTRLLDENENVEYCRYGSRRATTPSSTYSSISSYGDGYMTSPPPLMERSDSDDSPMATDSQDDSSDQSGDLVSPSPSTQPSDSPSGSVLSDSLSLGGELSVLQYTPSS